MYTNVQLVYFFIEPESKTNQLNRCLYGLRIVLKMKKAYLHQNTKLIITEIVCNYIRCFDSNSHKHKHTILFGEP